MTARTVSRRLPSAGKEKKLLAKIELRTTGPKLYAIEEKKAR